jgi:Tol biopolymer transport system component
MDGALRMLHPDGKRAVSHTNPRDEAAIARRDTEGIFVTETASGRKSLIVTLQDVMNLHPNKDNIGHCKLYIKHTKWSPDGKKLLFVLTNEIIYKGDQPRVKSIFVVNADGSGLRHILAARQWNHPSWHPDGRRILINLANEQGEMKMAYLGTETGRLEKVTERIPGGGHHPSVSPDGRRLVTEMVTYTEGPNGRQSSGTCEIIILDIEKDTVRRTTSFPLTNHSHSGTHVHPVWSRDSSSVLYNSDQSGHSELYLLKLNH